MCVKQRDPGMPGAFRLQICCEFAHVDKILSLAPEDMLALGMLLYTPDKRQRVAAIPPATTTKQQIHSKLTTFYSFDMVIVDRLTHGTSRLTLVLDDLQLQFLDLII